MKKVFVLLALTLTVSGLAQSADLEGRTLTVGSDTTYPPFETVDQQGNVVGFDVDIVNAICERVNCVAEFKTTAWDGIFPALAGGEFDMVASGVSITAERDQIVDFTDPYLAVTEAVAVRVEDEGLTLEDFTEGDLVLGAQTGTTNATTAETLVGRDRLRLYDNFNTAVQALLNGDVDGVEIDGTSADAFVEQYAGELTVSIDDVESGTELGFVVQEGDALVDALNTGLAEIKSDGTLDTLIEKWLAVQQ